MKTRKINKLKFIFDRQTWGGGGITYRKKSNILIFDLKKKQKKKKNSIFESIKFCVRNVGNIFKLKRI